MNARITLSVFALAAITIVGVPALSSALAASSISSVAAVLALWFAVGLTQVALVGVIAKTAIALVKARAAVAQDAPARTLTENEQAQVAAQTAQPASIDEVVEAQTA